MINALSRGHSSPSGDGHLTEADLGLPSRGETAAKRPCPPHTHTYAKGESPPDASSGAPLVAPLSVIRAQGVAGRALDAVTSMSKALAGHDSIGDSGMASVTRTIADLIGPRAISVYVEARYGSDDFELSGQDFRRITQVCGDGEAPLPESIHISDVEASAFATWLKRGTVVSVNTREEACPFASAFDDPATPGCSVITIAPVSRHGRIRGVIVLRTDADVTDAYCQALSTAGTLLAGHIATMDARFARNAVARELTEAEESLVDAIEAAQAETARDLHDSVAQRMAASTHRAHFVSSALYGFLCDHVYDAHDPSVPVPIDTAAAADGAYILATLESLEREVRSVTRETRVIAHELGPVSIGHGGLTEALVALSGTVNGFGIRCSTDFDVQTSAFSGTGLPEAVSIAAYRIAQEAVRNAARHGQAHSIDIRLAVCERDLTLEVVDDGSADLSEHVEGFGIRSMRARARAVGGTLEAGPGPGAGFVVCARLPIGPAIAP